MSSDPPSDAPSAPPERSARPHAALDLASLLRLRGAPLLEALEQHAPGAREHAEATASYAFAGAVGLGFDRAQAEVAREVAALHEVGVVYVPAGIARRGAAQRTPEEEAAWAEHYEAGYRLVRGAGIPEQVCGWLLRARERYDGTGPEGMTGSEIPVEGRLIRAACACQTTLAAARGGDEPPVEATVHALVARAGADLDPRVVAALRAILAPAADA